jgi:hypothetical protein
MTSIQSLLTGQVFTLTEFVMESDVYRIEGREEATRFIKMHHLKPCCSIHCNKDQITKYYHGLFSKCAGVEHMSLKRAMQDHLDRSAGIALYCTIGHLAASKNGCVDLFFYDPATQTMEVTCSGFQLVSGWDKAPVEHISSFLNRLPLDDWWKYEDAEDAGI